MSFFRPFALERYFAQYEFTARYLLCSSDCESMSVRELLAMEPGSEKALMDMRLGYTETRGAPTLRAEAAKQYTRLDADNIFIHAGAEEAILNMYAAILEAGDTVIVNTPCYESLAEIPRALGCTVMPWELRETKTAAGMRWFLDPDELPALCAKPPCAIVINAPHNPTGSIPEADEMNAIIAYARKTGTILIVDEVYRRLEFSAAPLPSIADMYENGIAVDVLSKHAGLAGLRIGWLASQRRDILDKVAVVKDYNSICSSGPSEVLAEIALRHLDAIHSRTKKIIADNIALLNEFFTRANHIVDWTPPRAGSVAFPHFTKNRDAGEIASALAADTGVLILPGALYGYHPAYFRLGFGRASMPEALSIFEAWLTKTIGV